MEFLSPREIRELQKRFYEAGNKLTISKQEICVKLHIDVDTRGDYSGTVKNIINTHCIYNVDYRETYYHDCTSDCFDLWLCIEASQQQYSLVVVASNKEIISSLSQNFSGVDQCSDISIQWETTRDRLLTLDVLNHLNKFKCSVNLIVTFLSSKITP